MKEKSKFVHQVFTSVASRYDIMNDIMSFGLHRLWKDQVVQSIHKGSLLDVACGTGDIAVKVANYKKDVDIVVCDININMLNRGRNNAVNANILNLKWVCGNAEQLPFYDNTFDYYTISFGIRNVSNRQLALNEAYRILKPGGKFICLEFSPLKKNHCLYTLYNFYSFKVIPNIGQLVAKDRASYQYLVDSIQAFPYQDDFIQEIQNSNFVQARYRNLCFGIVTLYTAWKV
ncbi:bifunctional demethylmenaquinone methyltransferase/2-methoxy-6-polyprenyl-1,4-benzoquinol methylase UbiE [Ehrlichia ruminantium]|uniref:Ubiquinone/menaquinone biosynthesis C-methyltransferase UbiE n=1 Tax=Ehrlichia ruminantium (strain Welgevonden) TaxID=254945 RepID=A0A0H3M1Y7_EHRRW|nr:bifunctional demethylmenaquinone methyltransferase/2-methoxy-6-polyprenyl-1,4-benzoquinol methylase UbiE [Ehrlichia ruminantium]QLK50858.1 bifunctional demethylmenaquinone methyltransferase/2-methoxy-6-polyprenyl-1,4-benzoquinol methylase UbiE [Ehrlichia ruminantium]QLK51780.1 bifunctional demethylmenaquinone methyltransferase/2-methoxy-6-polyprenyl-1,4-benzoquinol methylase UbiE [Ehrlichia ruminantium]QLK53619.1 bifunctional demethylmenaquinone methyltransferase/2-methoxy-6-polyprenyl-1,4-be